MRGLKVRFLTRFLGVTLAGFFAGGLLGCNQEGGSLTAASGGVADLGASVQLGCEEARFFRLINLYRAASGRAELAVSHAATLAARWHSQDMGEKDYFSHTDSAGRDPFQRLSDFGFESTSGENIAAGNRQAAATFCQWKNSPGHNRNMLEASFTAIGIGRAEVGGSTYGVYWATPFGWGGEDTTTKPQIREGEVGGCSMPSALPSC